MTKNLAFDFSVNKENKTITVKREFAAALPLVWDAYTKSEILDQWWAPKPWKARTKTMDFRNGGRWHYAMVGPEGEEHWAAADYSSIIDQKKFIVKDTFTDEAGTLKTGPESEWEVTFTSEGAVTLVEVHITFPALSDLETHIKMGFKEGFTMALGNLDELLASLKK